jgi:hypothetical protein
MTRTILVTLSIQLLAGTLAFAEPQAGWPTVRDRFKAGAKPDGRTTTYQPLQHRRPPLADAGVTSLERRIEQQDDATEHSICRGC